MSLDKLFGLYTISFLGVTILIGIAEIFFGLPNRWIGWLFMALSLLIYVFIGIVTRTSNPDQYYVAGRGVPAFYNGMATGSDWMSAASFISMGGALSAQGFAGLAYVMGWTGGYLLLAVFLGPYLRQFGAYTIPDFLGARYGGNAARVVGVIGAIACSFTYLIAQVTGVGLIVSRFIGLDFNVGVFVGLLGVLFCSVLGGMRSVTWTQVAQYIILIISYLVPVVYLSWQLFSFPVPELDVRQGAPAEQHQGHRDHAGRQGEGDARSLEGRRRRGSREDQGRRALRRARSISSRPRPRWPRVRPRRRRRATPRRSAATSPCPRAWACGTSSR